MIKTDLSTLLLAWYNRHGRNLPWRIKGSAHPDPYVVLVSEIMLQQTTVAAVIPYFQKFMQRFPTVQALADAELEEVYQHWQGLGYYSRARSLHATAKTIANRGSWPQMTAEVLRLKGIGTYTAASFLSLAFNLPETVVDGNVIRIICRLFHLTEPTDRIMDTIRAEARKLTDRNHPADYASAIMDLGALICTPKNPQCLLCPWHKFCLSAGTPELEQIPCRTKPAKQIKNGRVYLIYNSQGQVFIRKRTEKGLLSGLWEFPWSTDTGSFLSNAADTGKQVSHIFTHINLTLKIYALPTDTKPAEGIFVAPEQLKDYPLSSLMKKVFAAGHPAAELPASRRCSSKSVTPEKRNSK